jgi:PAS domain S-box-containing protein
MREFLEKLFSSDFMPHGYCYLWKPGLVWLHVISDALIALAYFSIPLTLIYFIRKRRDLPFNWMFVSFGMFILACGATHAMEVWTLWHGAYWLSGAIKVVTAIASVPTAILLVQLVPDALALPSPEAMRVEIAERKRTEQALHQAKDELELKVLERTAELRKSEAELRTIVETIPAYVGTNLPDGNVDFVSQSWLDYTGLSGEEWLGWGWTAVTHPEDVDGAVKKWKAALSTGEPIEQEIRVRQADGSYRWFLGRNVPLRDEKGNIVKWYGTLHDIEDQKRADEALRKSEWEKRNADLAVASERLRNEQMKRSGAEEAARAGEERFQAILALASERLRSEQIKRAGAEEAARAGEERFQVIADSLPEPLTEIGPDQRFRFTNSAFQEWFGLTSEQAQGRSVREVTGEEIYRIIQPYVEKAQLGQSASFEGHLTFKRTGRRYVHIDFVPRRGHGSEVNDCYSLLRDLTQLKVML